MGKIEMQDTKCYSVITDGHLGLVWEIGDTKFAIYFEKETEKVAWDFRGQKEWCTSYFPDDFTDALAPAIFSLFCDTMENNAQ